VAKILEQCATKQPIYGGITDLVDLRRNLDENAVPHSLLNDHTLEYFDFLTERRRLIATQLKGYYFSL
jgi:hypothetical protein